MSIFLDDDILHCLQWVLFSTPIAVITITVCLLLAAPIASVPAQCQQYSTVNVPCTEHTGPYKDRICWPEPRNLFPAWRNRCLVSINVYQYGLRMKESINYRPHRNTDTGPHSTFFIFVYCTVCRNVIDTFTRRASQQMLSDFICNPV